MRKITDSILGDMERRRIYEAGTDLVLTHVGGKHVRQSRMGRFEEHIDGTLYDGIGYEPAQIPQYFRVPMEDDRKRIEVLNRRVRKLQVERQAAIDAAWHRGAPLATEAAQEAARQRAATLKGKAK